MTKSFDLQVFGIRHHGPGSALSLKRALANYQPDIVLVEGPADANEALPWLGHEEMEPPVALVMYAPDQPKKAGYFPFAVFSPEFQALRYALSHDIPARFMDLPQGNMLAAKAKLVFPDMDPLQQLANAAGYANHEAWWNQLIEQRVASEELHDNEIFDAIFELMVIARSESEANAQRVQEERERLQNDEEAQAKKWEGKTPEQIEADRITEKELEEARIIGERLSEQREAYMRRIIRQARDEGHKRIAVVCGAWHGPALVDLSDVAGDDALLTDMPFIQIDAAWVPWTYGRLSNMTGYGSGVNSPGWYHHLWKMGLEDASPTDRSINWLTQVVELLRKEKLDASSAHIIEGVRLAEAVSAVRDLSYPGLPELMEATQAVITFGNVEPLRLIQKKLIISERMGYVPEDSPMVPLQRDLYREQRQLRIRPEPEPSTLNLDLRKEMHLARSHLLHRLNLLNIPWGKSLPVRNQTGTYREVWRLHWVPELTIKVIEANVWGNTVRDAAQIYAEDLADKATDLPTLTHLLDRIILADLPEVIDHLMMTIQERAALSSDIPSMIDALPPLVQALRYGSVRQTDKGTIQQVVDGLLRRIYIGLPSTCASLNDDAANGMFDKLGTVHNVVRTVGSTLDKIKAKSDPDPNAEVELAKAGAEKQTEAHRVAWYASLKTIAEQPQMHGLIGGRSCRLLMDSRQLEKAEAMVRMQRALIATPLNIPDVLQSAFWIEGFLKGSGLVLLHDHALWDLIDEWVMSIGEQNFIDALPMMRRTFADFNDNTRQQLNERIRQQVFKEQSEAIAASRFDQAQAEKVLPLAAQLLGIEL